MEKGLMEIIDQMTLEEKAGLCSGGDFWHTKGIERLGIKPIMMSDGPSGLRKQDDNGDNLGMNDSIKAVCFPSGCASACSFDRQMMKELGETLGSECRAEGIQVLLGPSLNIKRSPLCGRNFEYLSEDPFLAGELAAAQIEGIQSKGVASCPKHFAANNQEHRRMTCSSEIDERTFREIYLYAFERVVKKARPWAIMSSYNKVNGEYVSESHNILTERLRNQWGFDGAAISDWGGTADRVKGIEAGLDIEMPSSNGINDRLIVDAIKDGRLSEEQLNNRAANVLQLIQRTLGEDQPQGALDLEGDHEKARVYAEKSGVLLKNENQVLPISKDAGVVFIGDFAKKPRYQGGGSAHINAYKVAGAMDYAEKLGYSVSFAQGYTDGQTEPDDELIMQAQEAAKKADYAVIFAGLPEVWESEGYDRTTMMMPPAQNMLIEAVSEVQKNTIVVLHNGAPVEMPWAHKVAGILELYLGGQAVGEACLRLLYGDVNPSGRLAETVPYKLEDNPTYISFPGKADKTRYSEGVFVGYRYYTKKKMPVRYPFGYGLSYTSFEYDDFRVSSDSFEPGQTLVATVSVTNTGNRGGAEVVQLYVEAGQGEIIRPVRELKGFDKVYLEPGEKKKISFTLEERDFAYYDEDQQEWMMEAGTYGVAIGKNAEEMMERKEISVVGTPKKPPICTLNTTIGDLLKNEKSKQILMPLFQQYMARLSNAEEESSSSGNAISMEMIMAMINDMPLRALISLGGLGVSREDILQLIDFINYSLQ